MNTAKQRPHQVDCHSVVFLQCIDKVIHVVHVGNIDAKIVDPQAERDVSPDVVPETRSMLELVIPFDGKAFVE